MDCPERTIFSWILRWCGGLGRQLSGEGSREVGRVDTRGCYSIGRNSIVSEIALVGSGASNVPLCPWFRSVSASFVDLLSFEHVQLRRGRRWVGHGRYKANHGKEDGGQLHAWWLLELKRIVQAMFLAGK